MLQKYSFRGRRKVVALTERGNGGCINGMELFMPYRYRKDAAFKDIAFEAEGRTLKELFQAAAAAITNVMVGDPEAIDQKVIRLFEMEAPSAEMLLYHFLEELVFLKDSERLFFRQCEIDIDRDAPVWHLHVQASGEEIDGGEHGLLTDVRAVSFPDFRVRQTCDGWTADVLLDL
jgi:SHS2 domain-containing protein